MAILINVKVYRLTITKIVNAFDKISHISASTTEIATYKSKTMIWVLINFG